MVSLLLSATIQFKSFYLILQGYIKLFFNTTFTHTHSVNKRSIFSNKSSRTYQNQEVVIDYYPALQLESKVPPPPAKLTYSDSWLPSGRWEAVEPGWGLYDWHGVLLGGLHSTSGSVYVFLLPSLPRNEEFQPHLPVVTNSVMTSEPWWTVPSDHRVIFTTAMNTVANTPCRNPFSKTVSASCCGLLWGARKCIDFQ